MHMAEFPPRGGARGQTERSPTIRWTAGDALGNDWSYEPGKLLLGHDGERLLGVHDNRHIVTLAGSRSGKTLSLLIPNLLRYPGSTVVVDPKGELYRATADARRAMGHDVYALRPFARDGEHSDHFNPFRRLRDSSPHDLPADAAQLAEAVIEKGKGDAHWTDSAKNLWTGLILLGHLKCPEGVTIRWLRSHLTDSQKLVATWEEMALSDAFDGRLSSIGRAYLTKAKGRDEDGFDNRELQSILSTAQEQTRPLDDVAHISERSDFSFEQCAARPTTVYLILPALRIATHARWLRLVIYELLASLERFPVEVDIDAGKYPLRLILEEFAALGHMTAIETAAGYIAGFGVQMWAVLQDLTQIRTHYPNSWETFLGNAGVINAFNITDGTTTRYLSQLLGNTTILEARQTRLNANGVRGGDPGFDASPRSVPLLEPSEIALHFARETGRQLVLVPGQPPIHMQRPAMENTNG